jgi:ribonuclease HI
VIVTINTDASFSKQHEIGTFAFWIVCNRFKILQSGVLRKKVKRPEIAEFRCIINALHVLFNQDCKPLSKVIINTDCLNVIHLVKKNKAAIAKYKLKPWGDPLMKKYEELRAKHPDSLRIPIELRHVKSHTGVGDARSYVNEWCDRSAKEKLREEIHRRSGRVFNYLLADDGGISNAEMKQLMPKGIIFQHEYGTYEVREHLDVEGKPVNLYNEVVQVYCERISKNTTIN